MSEVRTSITSEELATLEIRRYEGEIRLVETPEDLARAVEDFASEAGGDAVVGFDTETRPAFKVGQSYLPSLVQLATGRAVYILPVQRFDYSFPIKKLFEDSRLRKVGISVSDDLKKLKQLFPFEDAGVLDLGTVAKRHGAKQTGVRNLAGMYLGFRIPKGKSTSNWAAPQLTAQQIAYAATDAWACRELYLRFRGLGML
jgi:ribonuclease D